MDVGLFKFILGGGLEKFEGQGSFGVFLFVDVYIGLRLGGVICVERYRYQMFYRYVC